MEMFSSCLVFRLANHQQRAAIGLWKEFRWLQERKFRLAAVSSIVICLREICVKAFPLDMVVAFAGGKARLLQRSKPPPRSGDPHARRSAFGLFQRLVDSAHSILGLYFEDSPNNLGGESDYWRSRQPTERTLEHILASGSADRNR